MTSTAVKTLGVFRKTGLFDKGLGASLPEAYKKFYKEWKQSVPAAVHYIPEEGKWKRDEISGQILPVQNVPIPVKYPPESNEQLWGGEGVVQGFQKRQEYNRRVPHFWVPVFKRSVVYSEVLDKHISVIVTDRALSLIHSHYGFDHYLLKTPACDLKSLLPLGLKRKILQELQLECPSYADRPTKQAEILKKYKEYLTAYTPEEIEWYGYSYRDACKKILDILEAQKKIVPLKQVYRAQLIEKLQAAQIEGAQGGESVDIGEATATWLQKVNPFGKKHET